MAESLCKENLFIRWPSVEEETPISNPLPKDRLWDIMGYGSRLVYGMGKGDWRQVTGGLCVHNQTSLLFMGHIFRKWQP
jgi:hypothetical protein